jgi:hypothetical protein
MPPGERLAVSFLAVLPYGPVAGARTRLPGRSGQQTSKDKALEYGKDLWMYYTLPTQHRLYFGIQVKSGKLDAAGRSKGSNANVAEVHAQLMMMLGHEIFDPEIGKRVLVDHAYVVAGGEITKAARAWLGNAIDASQRRQIIFMDRDDILNLYVVTNLPVPGDAVRPLGGLDPWAEEPPF